MKTVALRLGSSGRMFHSVLLLVILFATSTQADQIEMRNGDRYSGKVVALESNIVVLNSELLGTLRIRRDQVVSMSLGAAPAQGDPSTASSNAVPKAPLVPVVAPSAGPNPQIDLSSSLRQQIAGNPHLVSEVQSQVLAGAGPEALKKFDSIIGGLSTGTIDVADLRKEASSVAAQLRQFRNSGNDESTAIFDEYLAILDSFVAETKNVVPATTTNALPAAPRKRD